MENTVTDTGSNTGANTSGANANNNATDTTNNSNNTTVNTEGNKETQTNTPTKSVFDQFMEEDFSDDEQLNNILSTEHTKLKPFKEILKGQTTEEGRKLVANLRADYTRKTAEVSTIRKQLEAERAAVLAEKEALYKGEFAKRVQETASRDTSKLDPYVEEDLKQMIEIESAKKLQDMLKPMQQELEKQRMINAAQAFVDKHPEMKTEEYKSKLVPLITNRPDLDLETAYLIVKGQIADETAAKAKEQIANKNIHKQEQRNGLSKTTTTTNVGGVQAPKGMTAVEAMRFFANQNKK